MKKNFMKQLRNSEFERALGSLYPKIPLHHKKALIKNFKRNNNPLFAVLRIRQVVDMNVEGYIRHNLTNYETLIWEIGYKRARIKIRADVTKTATAWRGGDNAFSR